MVETNTSGVLQAAYTVEPQTYGQLASRRAAGATRFYHFDALGSTRLLTNSAQSSTDIYIDDAWGVPRLEFGSTVNPFRWVGAVGYYRDIETDLVYVRARVYAPTLARWMSQDPIAYALGRLYIVSVASMASCHP